MTHKALLMFISIFRRSSDVRQPEIIYLNIYNQTERDICSYTPQPFTRRGSIREYSCGCLLHPTTLPLLPFITHTRRSPFLCSNHHPQAADPMAPSSKILTTSTVLTALLILAQLSSLASGISDGQSQTHHCYQHSAGQPMSKRQTCYGKYCAKAVHEQSNPQQHIFLTRYTH